MGTSWEYTYQIWYSYHIYIIFFYHYVYNHVYIYNIYILYNDSIISTWKPRNHNSLRSASLGLAAQWWRGCHPSTRYLWDRCPKQDRCSSGTQKLGPGPQRDRNFIEIYMRYLLRVLFIGILREYHGIWNIMKRIYIYTWMNGNDSLNWNVGPHGIVTPTMPIIPVTS